MRRYPGKISIIKPGDTGDRLFYIVQGSCTVSMPHKETGEDIVLAYLNKGEFIGEIGVFLGPMVRDVTVKTREHSQLAEMTYARFHQLLTMELYECSSELLCAMGRQLSRRLLETSRKVGSLAFFDVSGRIAHTLLQLSKEPDAMTHPLGMQIRITRLELGRIVGCSREMAGRVLKSLEEQGVISVKGKTIVVLGTR
jgi:CRP/FNR family cyclic AMP-dependent transcriptional regulator